MFPIVEPEDDYGGNGTYSCATDYIKVVTSLLLDDGKLLKSESVKELFRPQLPDSKFLMGVLGNSGMASFLVPEFPNGVEWNYGLGGIVAVSGVEGRAGKGMMMWSGFPNSYWVSDILWQLRRRFLTCRSMLTERRVKRESTSPISSHPVMLQRQSCLQDFTKRYARLSRFSSSM